MIRLYIEEGLSLKKIAEHFKRSSRTPLLYIKKHNRAVGRSGFCPICRRARIVLKVKSLREDSYGYAI